MNKVFLILGLFAHVICSAQSDLDSLRQLRSQLEGKELMEHEIALANRLVYSAPKESEQIAQSALELSEKLGDRLGEARAYLMIGASYNVRSRTDTAIYLSQQALGIAEEIESQEQIAQILITLSSSYIRSYQLDLAMESLQRCLIVSREINNKDVEIVSLMNMAIVFTYLKNEVAAEEKLSEALKISKAMGFDQRTAQLYGNLGNLENERANYSLSKEYYLNALSLFEKLEMSRMLSILYLQLGRVSSELGEMSQALSFFDQSLEIRVESGNEKEIVSVKRYKVRAFFDGHQYAEAKALLNEILLTAENLSDYYVLKDLTDVGYRLAEFENDYQEALRLYKAFRVYGDSVDSRISKEEVKRQTAQFDNEQLSQQLEQERQDKEIAQLRQSQRGLLILILFLLIIGSFILYKVNRSRLKKQLLINQRANDTLNEEVTSQATKINAYKTEISKLEVQYHDTEDKRNRLIEFLNSSRIEAKDWASFKLLFNEAYPGLFSRFNQFKLTLNDQRLIALIILGLSTKEIASILGITPKSVSKSKARLSSKLELSETKLLEQFLQEIQPKTAPEIA